MAARKCDLDLKLIEALASVGCTMEEMARISHCSVDTLERRCADIIKSGQANLNMSLRRKQVELANAGNVTMLIWLGKQRLGQSDSKDNVFISRTPIFERITNAANSANERKDSTS